MIRLHGCWPRWQEPVSGIPDFQFSGSGGNVERVDLKGRFGIGCFDELGGEGLQVRGPLLRRGDVALAFPAETGKPADAAIVIGAEGVSQPTRELLFENNTFRNDGGWETIFVRNLTATDAVLRNNRFEGRVKPLDGDGSVTPR